MLLQKILNGGARVGAQFLYGAALAADDDGLLRVAFHIQSGPDADQVFVFFVAIHNYLNTVRDLLLILQKNLLADEFGNKEAHGPVGERVFWKIRRAKRQKRHYAFPQSINIQSFQSRDGKHIGIGENLLPVRFGLFHLFG